MIKYKTQFSPRLGFAFPITERDGFSFYYGRFVQFPGRAFLFASQEVVGNLGTLGNPNLDSETTISYQAALQHQFSGPTLPAPSRSTRRTSTTSSPPFR